MTTAGSNGGAPDGADEDDPFAYLYRPAEGEQPAPERPRTGYSRPMEVGRATYGERPVHPQAPPPGGPGHPPAAPGQETTALPQQSRYAERSRPRPGEDRPAGRGKAAVIGAVAVVAAIAIGAGVALSTGDPDGGKNNQAATNTHSPTAPAGPGSAAPSSAAPSPSTLSGGTDIADAAGLKLGGGSVAASQVPGAKGAGGKYVDGLGTVGASVSWDVDMPAAGSFQIWLRFNNSGPNATATVSVDGKPTYTPIKLNNYSPGLAPESSWYSSWVSGTVAQPGHHTISVACQADNQCGFLLDQIAVTPNGTSKVQGW
ncbi:hypothetical protein [Kitasatospora griseola]|uniref:hypothetical protein n=1 Tax=Kitasatospora griseola TaxID=2064 RepID=UPI001670C8E6|nr:hypothetical protein [Kitasatospora griseola]GGR06365.1 hypothetical protein GCM10010195_71920 [Kitasatospora griseola]